MMHVVNSMMLVAGADALRTFNVFKKQDKGPQAFSKLGELENLGTDAALQNGRRGSAEKNLANEFADIFGDLAESNEDFAENEICLKAPAATVGWGLELADDDCTILSVKPGQWAEDTEAFHEYIGWRIAQINDTVLRSINDLKNFKTTLTEGELMTITLQKVEEDVVAKDGQLTCSKHYKNVTKGLLNRINIDENCLENLSGNNMVAQEAY